MRIIKDRCAYRYALFFVNQSKSLFKRNFRESLVLSSQRAQQGTKTRGTRLNQYSFKDFQRIKPKSLQLKFLDVTLNLTDGTIMHAYRKRNNETLYNDTNSSHLPTIMINNKTSTSNYWPTNPRDRKERRLGKECRTRWSPYH